MDLNKIIDREIWSVNEAWASDSFLDFNKYGQLRLSGNRDLMKNGKKIGRGEIFSKPITSPSEDGYENYIALDRILIDPEHRNNGYADEFIKQVTNYADSENMIIVLTASSDFGASKPKLVKWYKSHGFIDNRGSNKDFRFQHTMIRLPKKRFGESLYSDQELEDANDGNITRDGGFAGFALEPDSVSSGGLVGEGEFDVDHNKLLRLTKYVESFDRIPDEFVERFDSIKKLYYICKNNLNKCVLIADNSIKFFNNMIKLQTFIDSKGTIKEEDKLSWYNEDGTSLYSGEYGNDGDLNEDRIKSWMPKMTTVDVKKKCRLGGNGDGTSDACDQGDISNLDIKPLKDGHSDKENWVNVAEAEHYYVNEDAGVDRSDKNTGCLMMDFDIKKWDIIKKIINPDDVYNEEGYGVESKPHVTVLYGFDDEVNGDEVIKSVKEVIDIDEIEVETNKISIFENDKFDVVKLDINSEKLHELNEKLSEEFPNKKTFPVYHPHMTIAYVKPGTGKKYVKEFKKNIKLNPSKYVYSKGWGEDQELNEAVKKSLPIPDGCDFKGSTLGEDEDGFFIYTHRGRSKSYKSPEKIPQKAIDWVETTG